MTQAAHALAQNIQQALRYRERIAVFLVAVISLSALMYIYYVREAVLNVVAREQVTGQIQADNTTVSNLENQYFALKSAVTMDTALAMGFEPTKASAFISADSGAAGLAYNETQH